jgi:hypothetical protein
MLTCKTLHRFCSEILQLFFYTRRNGGISSCLEEAQWTILKNLASKSLDDYADDGSANGSHADDRRISFGDEGIGDAQQ